MVTYSDHTYRIGSKDCTLRQAAHLIAAEAKNHYTKKQISWLNKNKARCLAKIEDVLIGLDCGFFAYGDIRIIKKSVTWGCGCSEQLCACDTE